MAGSSLGIWIAHGEGRVHFPDPAVFDIVRDHNLAPIRYDYSEILIILRVVIIFSQILFSFSIDM